MFSEHDFRTALLMIGAPTPRYHRRRGSDLTRFDRIENRVLFLLQLHEFCEQHFGSIGTHGSFVTEFGDAYAEWYDSHSCVKGDSSEA